MSKAGSKMPPTNEVHKQAVANPAPLGLAAFGITTFVLSCYNIGIGVGFGAPPNAVIGLAFFYGGLGQLLAGMWEFYAGNTFGATAFSSYGAFWLSYATIFVPWFDVVAAYGTNSKELSNALAIYLLGWAIFTFMLFLCTLRQNIASMLLFSFLTITFLLLSIANFIYNHPTSHKNMVQAGGYFGLFTAAIALYIALANLANKNDTFFTLPVGSIETMTIGEIDRNEWGHHEENGDRNNRTD